MSKNVAEYFACDVFNDEVMKARLPKPVYKAMTSLRATMARSPKAASFKRTAGKAVPLTA